MRWRITPKNDGYFDLLASAATPVATAADLLSQVLPADKPTRKALLTQIQAEETTCAELSRDVVRRANATFVTPIDRDDLRALASGIYECMSFIEEAADLIVLYELNELPGGVVGLVEVIQRAAELAASSMPKLHHMSELTEYWTETYRLERRSDKLHRKLLARIFSDYDDMKLIMKLKEVVDILEDGMDAFDALAEHIETVVLKEA